jgi:hypothetical protein
MLSEVKKLFGRHLNVPQALLPQHLFANPYRFLVADTLRDVILRYE